LTNKQTFDILPTGRKTEGKMRIKFHFYGWKIQIVKCDTCKKILGINFGCDSFGISHGKCKPCATEMIRKYKESRNGKL